MTIDVAAPQLGARSDTRIAEPVRARLWAKFWATRDRTVRNELVLSYESLVHAVVARLPVRVRANWEQGDLRGFGMLGLIEAIERFETASDPSRFVAYAMQRIRGSIFDELRRLDWVPRTVRRRVTEFQATEETLSAELGRVPAAEEVLTSMGVERGTGHAMRREVHLAELLHLHHGEDADSGSPRENSIDQLISDRDHEPEHRFLNAEHLDEVRRALHRLPERQRTVISLHLLGGATQQQIGAMLGITNSRVCQIEAAGLQTLRRMLGAI